MKTRTIFHLALGLKVLVVVIGVFLLTGGGNQAWFENGTNVGWKDGGEGGGCVQAGTLHETRENNLYENANSIALAPAVGDQKPRTTGVVELRFMGRLGNNLFEYAAARALADRKGWNLFLRTAPGNPRKYGTLLREDGMACFPGVRGLGPSTDSPEMKKLAWSTFRGVRQELADDSPRRIIMESWFQDYSLFSDEADHLREVMALNSSCCGKASPGENDLVIHFRNYRGELTENQYKKLFFKDLDFEYYNKVLRDVANSAEGPPKTVWVVGEFEEEGNPFMNYLRNIHGDVRKAEGVDGQFEAFCYLSRAHRLVMAQSTFSWWTAFLGSASEIHFPLFPRGRGVTVPQLRVKNESRYVYRNFRGDVTP